MPTELEVKLRLPSHDPLRHQLRALSATLHHQTLETNTFLDTPTSSLRTTDQGLRIRRNQRQGQQDELIITYKGPKTKGQGGAYKSREEIELTVDSYDNAIALLSRLGYHITLSFQKKRETWTLNDAEIVLDELPPPLGTFAEIEAPTEQSITQLLTALNLNTTPRVSESYIELVANYLKSYPAQTQLNFQ
jgi:adenylate cyclase class 2